jgi:hypothetical protein
MAEQQLSVDLFESLIGRTFHVQLRDGVVDLTLQSVTRLPPPRRRDRQTEEIVALDDTSARKDPFTLIFGEAKYLLPQATYRLSAEGLTEPLEIFIVPVAQDQTGFSYQAIFG